MSFEVCYKEHDLCYGTETKRSSYTNSSQSAVAIGKIYYVDACSSLCQRLATPLAFTCT